MKKVSLLIPVFNNIDFTKKCILNLLSIFLTDNYYNSEYSIVVIDDGSTDGTSKWLETNHPEIHLLKGDGNLWWSGGINVGTEFCRSQLNTDFILLWNNDIIPAKDYFTELDELIADVKNHVILGSKIYRYSEGEDDIIWSLGGVFNPKNGKKYLIGYDAIDSEEYNEILEVDWLPGMGSLIPMNVIETIGLWNEKEFPQYHGDSDFTFRAKTAGYNLTVHPRLKLWNDKTVSGLKHGGTLKGLFASLTDIRSNSNIKKNFRFYKIHSTSICAYRALFVYYLRYFLSFWKWKLLALVGITKSERK